MVAVSFLLGLIGLQTLPTLDHGYPLHLFTIGPGIIGALSSVATGSKLADFDDAGGCRLVLFRGSWCLVVTAFCGGVIWPAAVAMHRLEIVDSTFLLVALTFAASTAVGVGAWLVGAVNTALALTLPRVFESSDPITELLNGAHAYAWSLTAATTIVCAICFAAGRLGSTSTTHFRFFG